MKFPGFWPDGSKIIDNPSQVSEINAHEKRSAKINEIQTTLRTQNKTLPEKEKKVLLAQLFDLMEEDEVARQGDFDTEGHLHMLNQEEKDRMYATESTTTRAVNDSEIEAGGGRLVA